MINVFFSITTNSLNNIYLIASTSFFSFLKQRVVGEEPLQANLCVFSLGCFLASHTPGLSYTSYASDLESALQVKELTSKDVLDYPLMHTLNQVFLVSR